MNRLKLTPGIWLSILLSLGWIGASYLDNVPSNDIWVDVVILAVWNASLLFILRVTRDW